MKTGIRERKDNHRHYIRRVEAGERVVVTARGRAVAELVRPSGVRETPQSEFDRLIAAGVITPPSEEGDPLQGWPKIRLPRGTAAGLIAADRDED